MKSFLNSLFKGLGYSIGRFLFVVLFSLFLAFIFKFLNFDFKTLLFIDNVNALDVNDNSTLVKPNTSYSVYYSSFYNVPSLHYDTFDYSAYYYIFKNADKIISATKSFNEANNLDIKLSINLFAYYSTLYSEQFPRIFSRNMKADTSFIWFIPSSSSKQSYNIYHADFPSTNNLILEGNAVGNYLPSYNYFSITDVYTRKQTSIVVDRNSNLYTEILSDKDAGQLVSDILNSINWNDTESTTTGSISISTGDIHFNSLNSFNNGNFNYDIIPYYFDGGSFILNTYGYINGYLRTTWNVTGNQNLFSYSNDKKYYTLHKYLGDNLIELKPPNEDNNQDPSDDKYKDDFNNLNSNINNMNSNINSNINDMNSDINSNLNNINNNIMDPSSPTLPDFSGLLPEGPVDSLLVLPVNFLGNLTNLDKKVCKPLKVDLPFVNQNFTIPCIGSYLNEKIPGFKTWWTFMGSIFSAVVLYSYFMYVYEFVDGVTTLRPKRPFGGVGGV